MLSARWGWRGLCCDQRTRIWIKAVLRGSDVQENPSMRMGGVLATLRRLDEAA